jgi:hypothetical protein
LSVGHDEAASPDEKRAAANEALIHRRDELSKESFPDCLDADHLRVSITTWREELVQIFEDFRESVGDSYPDDLGLLVNVSMEDVYKNPHLHLGTTGLVFAGFWGHDIPSYGRVSIMWNIGRKTSGFQKEPHRSHA